MNTGITLDNFGGVIFFVQSSLASWILLFIAQKWKYFMNYWSKQENVFLKYPYTINGRKLGSKIRLVVYYLFIIATCKYILSLMTQLIIN